MEKRFIKVKSVAGYHLIDADVIVRVSPYTSTGTENKSKIIIRHDVEPNGELYSTETQEEIFNKLNIK